MVEVDARDDREDRRQNVGGVEAAAQANFDNPEFNAFAREAFERHGGNAFEIRGVSAKPVPTEKLLDELQQASKNSSKGFIFDFPAIEAHALVDSLEMRGGIQPGAKARMPKNRFQKSRCRAFAIGSRDVSARISPVRATKALGKNGNVLQVELGRRGLRRRSQFPSQGQKIANRRVVIHLIP